ncbi:MAG: AhpC/TSA family protein [Odoribacteraceae bacterium]|jgi:thiol-disulfide isomerase/thioredoxin|nr:AhpC/TSA family protein [Odoribacteraceae bacterium]
MRTIILLASLALALDAAAATDGYTLRGKIDGLPDSARVTLTPAATRQAEKPAAGTVAARGRFEIKGDIPAPRLFRLQVGEPPAAAYQMIMIEPGMTDFEATIVTDGNRWRWQDARVTGSAAHLLYLEKTRFRERLNERNAAIREEHREISRKLGDARSSGDTATYNALRRSPEYVALERDERAFFRHAGEEINAAISANGDSFWGPLLALVNYIYFVPGDTVITRVYSRFSDAAKNSYYGQIMHRELFPPRLVGKPLPPFSLPDRDGKMHDDATTRNGKKLVVIDFWASWCAPCRQEIPRLKELYLDYSSAGLEIISISIDRDASAWRTALDDERMPWPQLLDVTKLFSDQFHGKTIPALFLVDASGTVIEDTLRGQPLRDFIAAKLGAPPPR